MSSNDILRLLGLAKKAGRLEVGEEPVGAGCRARQVKLVLTAADAADNSRRRAAHFAQAGSAEIAELPCSKAELGHILGRNTCAMVGLTDAGFASAVCTKLSVLDGKYAAPAERLQEAAQKALQRQKEQRQHEKNLRQGKKKPWAPPPKPLKTAEKKAEEAQPVQPQRPKGRVVQVKGKLPRKKT